MKQLLVLFLSLISFYGYAQVVDIPDPNFLNALIEDGVDINGDGMIQVSEAELVTRVNVDGENITDLTGIEAFSNITELLAFSNALTHVDISQNGKLEFIILNLNPIEYLNIRNGITNLCEGSCLDLDNLKYLCIDDFEYDAILEQVNWGQNPPLEDFPIPVNTYCNYSTGTSYKAVLTNYFSEDEDCMNNFTGINYLPFLITEDSIEYKHWPSIQIDKTILNFASDSVEIKPCLDTFLFESNPHSQVLEFANTTDTLYREFCIYPKSNNEVTDVAISLLPITIARPGFNTQYRVILENRGNLISSGSIKLSFPNDVIDFLSSTESFLLNGNTVDWTYSDLLPLQRKIIQFETKNNAPTDTPPLNNGDTLKLQLDVIPNLSDLNSLNNTSKICVPVRNAYDPNDKRCLQGRVVEETLEGKFLDYRIRFENTGQAEALNVTIQDTLDINVFDISSLKLVDASHSVQLIQKDNAIEFIFNDINLPYEINQNDGYVFYKIKTLDNLQAGTVIQNYADIYFDFNWPIRTNTDTVFIRLIDLDNDGFDSFDDCDDTDPNINPNATEITYNGMDDDCNPLTLDDDLDQDGFVLVDDCDDYNPLINPDQSEIPYNGLDDDCNPMTLDDDLDQDGYVLINDCDDTSPLIYNGAEELCDGLDNDCDMEVDEGLDLITYYIDADQDGYGDDDTARDECSQPDGLIVTGGDCDDSNPAINPDAVEIPNNGIDEDCDGMDLISAVNDIAFSSLKMYPNPFSHSLMIEQSETMVLKLEIIDVTGKSRLSDRLKNRLTQIELNHLESGVYIVQISDLNKVAYFKVIKE